MSADFGEAVVGGRTRRKLRSDSAEGHLEPLEPLPPALNPKP